MIDALDFTPEPWLYVQAHSPERALAFIGAPRNWPIEWDRVDLFGGEPCSVWRVKAEGLKL